MARLTIISAGPATSVQDAGRFGAQRYGLAPSGAMDRLALARANTLAGNDPFAAAIELGPFNATIAAKGTIRLALSGASRDAAIGDHIFPCNESFVLNEGDTLKLSAARDDVFSYLAIEGTIRGTETFGSLSVNARAGLGSPYPRPLQAGDRIDVIDASTRDHELALDLQPRRGNAIRVVMGPQDDEFGDARDAFLQAEWTISAASDRMGFRLEGPPIKHASGHNIVSDGTVTGSIQVPGNGQPIVLMPDRGTTGGYPKIATVIGPDLGLLAQTQVGRRVRFAAIGIAEAQAEAKAFAKLVGSLKGMLRDANASALNLEALRSANIAGAAVNALTEEL